MPAQKSDIDDGDVKTQIIKAAAQLFQQKGYGKTKIAEIARATGLTPPTLYWHFESKEDILYAFLKSSLDEFHRYIDAALDGVTDPVDRLRSFVAAHTRAQLSQLPVTQAYFSITYSAFQLASSLPAARYDEIQELHRRHLDNGRAIIQQGLDAGVFDVPDLAAATFAILNIAEYSAMWFKPGGKLTAEELAATNAVLALRIVGAGGA